MNGIEVGGRLLNCETKELREKKKKRRLGSQQGVEHFDDDGSGVGVLCLDRGRAVVAGRNKVELEKDDGSIVKDKRRVKHILQIKRDSAIQYGNDQS